jgi:alkylhydroperoxidase family enzyme
VGRRGGITEAQLRALDDYERAGAFTEAQLEALRYADAITATPVEVPDAVFASLRARYDDAQIVELTSALAWENYRARFDHALGVEAEGYSEGSYCPLPPRKPAP